MLNCHIICLTVCAGPSAFVQVSNYLCLVKFEVRITLLKAVVNLLSITTIAHLE